MAGPSKAYVKWDKVKPEVKKAAKALYGKKQFVAAKQVAEFIAKNPKKYKHFDHSNLKSTQLRATKAMLAMKWKVYAKKNRSGHIFIAPW